MRRTSRLWKGLGPWTLGGLALCCAGAFAAPVPTGSNAPPSLSAQLIKLGNQAVNQGEPEQARSFFRKALEFDPKNADARSALSRLKAPVRRVALQEEDKEEMPAKPGAAEPADAPARPDAEPAAETPPPPAPEPLGAEPLPAGRAAPARATIGEAKHLQEVATQQLVADIRSRIADAQRLLNAGAPEAALNTLRLAQSIARSAEDVALGDRSRLDRELQTQILATVRAEERIAAERAEALRREAQAEQQLKALDLIERTQDTVSAMMIQFDNLMAQGQYNVLYNGGIGDIMATTAPFVDARIVAQKARALEPNHAAPRAGMFVAQTMGFLAQELAFESIKEYRFMLTMQDVARAAIPFPDTQTIEYPDAELWRNLSERRIKRYGKAVDLLDRDPKTKSILAKLDEPISMSFANETPLEDVLKYIKQATQGANDQGIPIYVDPVGLQEAEKTMTSPVQLDLEGVPLKTTLRLLLKQLGLTYTVKDGLLTITSESSENQPTEIRVYPVADLAIIPMSLMGGGGGGMGGRGGMGGGMGGMGGGMMGGMGGMGGGMGGMGGGMGGMGMMSIPVDDQDAPSGFLEKKSN